MKEIGELIRQYQFIDLVHYKILREDDIGKIGQCILEISHGNKELGYNLVNKIDIAVLSSKIEREESLGQIGIFLSRISNVNKEIGVRFVNIVSSKIDKEEDLQNIGFLFLLIAVNEYIGLKLVNNIDIIALSSKFKKENSNEKIDDCLRYISALSVEVGMKLVETWLHNTDKDIIKKYKEFVLNAKAEGDYSKIIFDNISRSKSNLIIFS